MGRCFCFISSFLKSPYGTMGFRGHVWTVTGLSTCLGPIGRPGGNSVPAVSLPGSPGQAATALSSSPVGLPPGRHEERVAARGACRGWLRSPTRSRGDPTSRRERPCSARSRRVLPTGQFHGADPVVLPSAALSPCCAQCGPQCSCQNTFGFFPVCGCEQSQP